MQGIELFPVLAQMSAWGLKYLPVTEESSIRAELLDEGGPKFWADCMDELRLRHVSAIDVIAAHWEGCSGPRSRTRRMARSRTSGEIATRSRHGLHPLKE